MFIQQHATVDRRNMVSEHRTCEMTCAPRMDDTVDQSDLPIETSGRDLPDHLRVQTAPLRPALSDLISQRLSLLLSLHPEIDCDYQGIDLRKIGAARRRQMLDSISRRLNIPSLA